MAETDKLPKGELLEEAGKIAARVARSITPREMRARYGGRDDLTGQPISRGERILYGASRGVPTTVKAEHGEQVWRLAHAANLLRSYTPGPAEPGQEAAGNKVFEWFRAVNEGRDPKVMDYARETGVPVQQLGRTLSMAVAARELGAERLLRENVAGVSRILRVDSEGLARALERPQAVPGGGGRLTEGVSR